MMYVALLFPEDQSWTDISHLVRAESYRQENLLMNDEYMSVVDSVSLSLVYDRLLLAKIMHLQHDQKIFMRSFFSDGSPAFFGYAAANVSHQKDEFLHDLALEFRDNSWKFDKKILQDFQIPSSIDSAGITVADFFQAIVQAAGYELSQIDQELIPAPEIIQMVSAAAGKTTYRRLLDEVLRDYGYVFTTTATGQLTLYQWNKSAHVVEGTLSHEFSTATPLKIQKREEDYDGVVLSWSEAEILSNVCLFQDSLPLGSNGIPSGVVIAPGAYYPEHGDSVETYQKYRTDWLDRAFLDREAKLKNQDIALISTDSQYAVIQADEGITVSESYDRSQAKILFHNPTDQPLSLYVFEIWGRALFKVTSHETRYPAAAVDPFKEYAPYIYGKEAAERLSKGLYAGIAYGDLQYSFALTGRLYQPGAMVRLVQEDPYLDTTVVICSSVWTDDIPGVQYEAKGIADAGDLSAVTASYMSSKVSEKGQPGEDAIMMVVVSTHGTIFRPALTQTTLEARVYQAGEEITARYDPSRFRWTRTSLDTGSDDIWNSAHYSSGGKSIQITDEDVEKRATFFCELI